MSVFEKDFLVRVKSPEASAKASETIAQPENAPLQKRAGQPDSVEKLAKKAREGGPTGPLALEPDDQTNCSPGVRDCPRSMPAWRRQLHQEVSNEQRLLEGIGGWCG